MSQRISFRKLPPSCQQSTSVFAYPQIKPCVLLPSDYGVHPLYRILLPKVRVDAPSEFRQSPAPLFSLSHHNYLRHGQYVMYSMGNSLIQCYSISDLGFRFYQIHFCRTHQYQICSIIRTHMEFLITQISFTHPLKRGRRMSPLTKVSIKCGSAIKLL